MPPSLYLNAIVKNEADKIERMLKSVIPFINGAVIYDTGSTDGTPALMSKILADAGLLHTIVYGEFINFEQARNAALDAARNSNHIWDYLLLVDADMELVVEDVNFKNQLKGAPAYNVIQKAGTLSYDNCRLVSRAATGKYIGVTHEYLDVPSLERINGIWFRDHADGSNRPDKFKRDIALLLPALEQDPTNGRYWFYLAQSYRDAGQPKEAADAYRKRIALGGWDEEVWNARVNLAAALKDMGDEAGFIRELLEAYNYRPSRAEALYDLAKFYREKGMNYAALMVAEEGMKIPRTGDLLFVNDYVYNVGLKEEFSIAAYYDPNRRERGFGVCEKLSLDSSGSDWTREQAMQNLYHYLKPLGSYVKTFEAKQIKFDPPDGYTPMNPSVAVIDGRIMCNIRAVNYSMDEHGRYLIRSTNGEANGDNPIHTRNFLLELGNNFRVRSAREIYPSVDLPNAKFNLVVGFEDCRLFEWQGQMWVNACVREQNSEGWCEQWIARVEQHQYGGVEWCVLTDARPMLPVVRQHEKNWAPMVTGDKLEFVYRLGTIVDDTGAIVSQRPMTGLHAGHISGGSQVIPFMGGYLSVVHEARHFPGTGKRYYQHRFVFYDNTKRVAKLSRPFVLHEKVIEFVSGLAVHPKTEREELIMTYGREDKEAWVATMDMHDVAEFIWHE